MREIQVFVVPQGVFLNPENLEAWLNTQRFGIEAQGLELLSSPTFTQTGGGEDPTKMCAVFLVREVGGGEPDEESDN